jgi:hypothetical protein
MPPLGWPLQRPLLPRAARQAVEDFWGRLQKFAGLGMPDGWAPSQGAPFLAGDGAGRLVMGPGAPRSFTLPVSERGARSFWQLSERLSPDVSSRPVWAFGRDWQSGAFVSVWGGGGARATPLCARARSAARPCPGGLRLCPASFSHWVCGCLGGLAGVGALPVSRWGSSDDWGFAGGRLLVLHDPGFFDHSGHWTADASRRGACRPRRCLIAESGVTA